MTPAAGMSPLTRLLASREMGRPAPRSLAVHALIGDSIPVTLTRLFRLTAEGARILRDHRIAYTTRRAIPPRDNMVRRPQLVLKLSSARLRPWFHSERTIVPLLESVA